jgi:hypothetical protein
MNAKSIEKYKFYCNMFYKVCITSKYNRDNIEERKREKIAKADFA